MISEKERAFEDVYVKYLMDNKGLSQSSARLYARMGRSILRSRQTPAEWLASRITKGGGAPAGTVVSYQAGARHLWAFLSATRPTIAGERPAVDMKRVTKKSVMLVNALDEAKTEQYLKMLAEDRVVPADARVLLAMLPLTGLRIGEAVALRKDDLVKRSHVPCLRIRHGKGDKERFVPLGKRAIAIVNGYVKSSRTVGPWLFPSPHDPQRHVSDSSIRRAHDIIRAKLGPGWEEVRMHDLRHTYASRLIERGVPLEAVRDLLGHDSSRTTEGYVHSNVTALKRYVEGL